MEWQMSSVIVEIVFNRSGWSVHLFMSSSLLTATGLILLDYTGEKPLWFDVVMVGGCTCSFSIAR